MRTHSAECARSESARRCPAPRRFGIDSQGDEPQGNHSQSSFESQRAVELERELETTRSKLKGAIHELEILNAERKAINEKLAALNSVLRQTLARRRIVHDFKNLPCSPDIGLQIASLTLRQRQVMEMVLAGRPNKNIAAALGISQRTVESHRACVMKKTGAKSLPALARMALAGAWSGAHEDLAQARLPDPRGAMSIVGNFRVYESIATKKGDCL